MNKAELFLDLLDLEKEIQAKINATETRSACSQEARVLNAIFWVKGYLACQLNEERFQEEQEFLKATEDLIAATIDLSIENVPEEERLEAEAFKERFLASLIRTRDRREEKWRNQHGNH